MNNSNRPSEAFILASWVVLLVGILAFLLGLWNSDMILHEKGYYLAILMLGLFSAVSLQKSVRDRSENIRDLANLPQENREVVISEEE